MPQIERWDLPDELGGDQWVMYHHRPTAEQIRSIGNYYARQTAVGEPFNVIRHTITQLCTAWEVRDPDTRDLIPFGPKGIDHAPQDVVKAIFDELWGVIEPLIPNFQRARAEV